MPTRPTRGEPTAHVLSVRITVSERRALRALARANSLTLSSLVAEALAELAGDLGERPPLSCRIGSCTACPYCHTPPAD